VGEEAEGGGEEEEDEKGDCEVVSVMGVIEGHAVKGRTCKGEADSHCVRSAGDPEIGNNEW
jgi:hypothetical protein